MCLFIHSAHRAIMSEMHWTELPRAGAFISASCLVQCLTNNGCLIEAVENRASFLKNKAHHLVSSPLEPQFPEARWLGFWGLVDPWGCLTGSK